MKFKYQKVIKIAEFEKEFEDLANKVRKIKLPAGFFDFLFYAISELFTKKNMQELVRVQFFRDSAPQKMKDKIQKVLVESQ